MECPQLRILAQDWHSVVLPSCLLFSCWIMWYLSLFITVSASSLGNTLKRVRHSVVPRNCVPVMQASVVYFVLWAPRNAVWNDVVVYLQAYSFYWSRRYCESPWALCVVSWRNPLESRSACVGGRITVYSAVTCASNCAWAHIVECRGQTARVSSSCMVLMAEFMNSVLWSD